MPGDAAPRHPDFRDKHDLLAWMFLETMGDLNIISIPDVTAALKRMKEDYRFFARAYEDTSQVPFWHYMLEYYVKSFADRAMDCLGTGELDPVTAFCIRLYCYGGVGMTHEWLAGSDISAEKLVSMYYSAMPETLREIYQIDTTPLDTVPNEIQDGRIPQ